MKKAMLPVTMGETIETIKLFLLPVVESIKTGEKFRKSGIVRNRHGRNRTDMLNGYQVTPQVKPEKWPFLTICNRKLKKCF